MSLVCVSLVSRPVAVRWAQGHISKTHLYSIHVSLLFFTSFLYMTVCVDTTDVPWWLFNCILLLHFIMENVLIVMRRFGLLLALEQEGYGIFSLTPCECGHLADRL